jgi:hypothetical protein
VHNVPGPKFVSEYLNCVPPKGKLTRFTACTLRVEEINIKIYQIKVEEDNLLPGDIKQPFETQRKRKRQEKEG